MPPLLLEVWLTNLSALARGWFPSEPPTAYKQPPRLATPTPNLGVVMELTCRHVLAAGS